VAGALLPRESTLEHAFHNPGPLSKAKRKAAQAAAAAKEIISPPIKAQLIGTDKDSQLKAALTYIGQQSAGSPAEPG
jgi:carboxyl-terminal processing protease